MSVQEIAKRAGVSTATVSRVLNRSNLVRPKTRERVEAVIAELGYQINVLARNLRTAESRLLLAMVPDFSNPFYAEIVRGIETTARSEGYHLLLCDTGADQPDARPYFDMLRNRLADGAICLDPETTQHALRQEMAGLSWVACCEFDPAAGVPYVGIDNEQAAFDAVCHLIARGRKRIALLNSDERYMYARQRRRGYEAALAQAGLEPLPVGQTMGLSFEDGRHAVAGLLKGPVRPDAIFAVSDTLAIGAIRGLRDAGLSVPDAVSVVGFDNIPIGTMVEPQLTTVEQPMRQLGETAARLLLQRLEDPDGEARGVLLDHRLVVRESA